VTSQKEKHGTRNAGAAPVPVVLLVEVILYFSIITILLRKSSKILNHPLKFVNSRPASVPGKLQQNNILKGVYLQDSPGGLTFPVPGSLFMKRLEAMKKTLIMALTILVILVGGCTQKVTDTSPGTNITGEHVKVPVTLSNLPSSGSDAADNIVHTPGGDTYRANVHEQGVPDKWPEIETVETRITSDSDVVLVRYRKDITTKAGEIRNNLLNVRKEDEHFDNAGFEAIKLYTIGAPESIRFRQYPGGGLPGTIATVLVIEIPANIKSGQYNFLIGIEIESKDYGTLPCTIEVTE
jgi:hypothetical protein